MSILNPVPGLLDGGSARRSLRRGAHSGYRGTLVAVRETTAAARAGAATHDPFMPACGGGTLRPSRSQRELAAALREGRL